MILMKLKRSVFVLKPLSIGKALDVAHLNAKKKIKLVGQSLYLRDVKLISVKRNKRKV